jgi:hypothetical protein
LGSTLAAPLLTMMVLTVPSINLTLSGSTQGFQHTCMCGELESGTQQLHQRTKTWFTHSSSSSSSSPSTHENLVHPLLLIIIIIPINARSPTPPHHHHPPQPYLVPDPQIVVAQQLRAA